MKNKSDWCPKCKKRHDLTSSDNLIQEFLVKRGFTKIGGFWLLPELQIKIRHKRIREWIKHLDSEGAQKRLIDLIDYIIKNETEGFTKMEDSD